MITRVNFYLYFRAEIVHANSRYSNSEKNLAGVKKELGQVQVDYERSQRDLSACVKSGLIVLNALPDGLAVGKVKKAGDNICNTRANLPFNIDDSYLLVSSRICCLRLYTQTYFVSFVFLGKCSGGIERKWRSTC